VGQSHQILFLGCGLIFLIFWVVVQLTLVETRPDQPNQHGTMQGFGVALRDHSLLIFVLANLLFTTYIALVTTTIPLYFTNFISAVSATPDLALANTANLFTWCYIGVGAIVQMPIASLLQKFSRVRVLMLAMILWALGFLLVWGMGTVATKPVVGEVVALSVLSIASVVYKPFASAIVSELAPESLRGAYLAVSSQCWAIGYFIGPLVGGWAMDQPVAIAHHFWLIVAFSTLGGLAILQLFNHRMTAQRDLAIPLKS
jgi:MFS family permease